MKKYVQNFWVRFLACILCTFTLIGAIVSGVLLVGVAMIGSQEDVNESGREIIAENYAAYIYDHLDENSPEKMDEFLADKNFSCAVIKVDNNLEEDVSLEEKSYVLYSNLEDAADWDYQIEIEDGSYVQYNIDAAWDALRISPVIREFVYTEETPIIGYAFDVQSGLFYYYTDSGYYFLADYIIVSDGDSSYDYKIKNVENQKVYYNSYYGRTLDTSQYAMWNWVKINGTQMTISEHASGKEVAIVTDGTLIQENLYTDIYYEFDNGISYYPERNADVYIIQMKTDDLTYVESFSYDMFLEWENLQHQFYTYKDDYQAGLIGFIVLFILSFALLIFSASDDKENLGFLQRVPVGIFTGCMVLIEIPLLVLMHDVIIETFSGYTVFPFEIWLSLTLLVIFVMILVAVIWLQNIISRFKTRTFIRHSELYYGYKVLKWLWIKVTQPFKAAGTLVRENISLFVKGLFFLLGISFVELIYMVGFCWYDDMLFFGFILVKLVEIPVVILVLMQMHKLQEGSKRIAAGDLSEPIDTRRMFWEFKKHGENINKVSEGIALAVEDRMKSERFKTELITNVSHDIKTPLTSIINYVDLIKKEDVEDEKLREYVDVLDRQSARLKKLIEDLMEASKASTGNLAVNMEDCDAEVLLTQLVGEFEEKLMANNLEVVVNKPDKPVMIKADGRHMWRVFDNLLNNACKYSLPGTRVYVTLTEENGVATITFRNISKVALNIPSDELMERFVRGDSSRNTEGSGLGLSIAQSLTELMNGTMKLDIDGDLFKVTLRFDAIKE